MRDLRYDEIERFGLIRRPKQHKNRYKTLNEDGKRWVREKM